MKRLTLLLLLLTPWFCAGQEVVQRQVSEDVTESYLVYLPNGYDAERLFPVVFVFDPMGNGSAALQHFIPVADTFGFIVVASEETRNGRHRENFDLAARMINSVLESYPILKKRMYLSGFSGGSRLASAIAVLAGQFEGVVGCGSGFSPNPSEQPRNEVFSYIGIVGDEDMNYAEMHEDYNRLRDWRFDNSLLTFAGPHRWPDTDALRVAFGWLEFRAHQKELPTIWPQLKNHLFELERESLRSMDTVPSIHLRKRVHRLSYMYPERYATDDWAQTRGVELMQDEALKTEQRLEESLIGFETAQIERDNDRLLQFFLQPKKQFKAMKGYIDERKQQLEAAGGMRYRQQYQRLLRNLYANLYERGIGYGTIEEQDLERAYYSNELLLEIRPDPRNLLVRIELITATQGAKKAVKALQSLLRDGELSKQRVEQSGLPVLLGDRSDYQKLMASY